MPRTTDFDYVPGEWLVAEVPKSTKQSPPIFNTTGAQSNGITTLKRMEFEFDGQSYKFSLNPEEYSQSEPARIAVTQTKAGAWLDDFGAGLINISMKGTTGFKNGVDNSIGFVRLKELRDLIRQYYYKQDPGTEVTSDKELKFHNYTDGEHWIVAVRTFDLFRSVSRPLMYGYSIQLTVIRPASQPIIPLDILDTDIAKIELES